MKDPSDLTALELMVLRVMRSAGGRPLDAELVSQEVHRPASAVAPALGRLLHLGLLTYTGQSHKRPTYKAAPQD